MQTRAVSLRSPCQLALGRGRQAPVATRKPHDRNGLIDSAIDVSADPGSHDPRGAQAYWLAPAGDGGLGGITVQDRIRAMVARGETDYGDVTHQSLTTDAGPNAPGGPGADSGP